MAGDILVAKDILDAFQRLESVVSDIKNNTKKDDMSRLFVDNQDSEITSGEQNKLVKSSNIEYGIAFDIFFDRYKKFLFEQDYNKMDANKPVTVQANDNQLPITVPRAEREDKKESGAGFDMLDVLVGVGALAATLGTTTLGELFGSIVTAAKPLISGIGVGLDLIKGFFTTSAAKIGKGFGDLLGKIGLSKAGKFITDVAGDAGKWGGKFLSMLFDAPTSFIKGLGKALRFVPILGSLINLYQSYVRFSDGDILGGILEIGAGVAGFFPGVGTAISIGLDAFLILRDLTGSDTSSTESGSMLMKATGFIGKIASSAFTFLKPLAKTLKFIPFLGSIFSFASAWDRFNNGQVVSGIIDIAAGIANFFPGIGTAISVGLDVINMFVSGDANNENTFVGKGVSWVKSVFSSFVPKFLDFIKPAEPYLRKMPVIGMFFPLYDAWNNFSNGDVRKGLFNVARGLGMVIPVAGIAISYGLDILENFMGGEEVATSIPSIDTSWLSNMWTGIKNWVGDAASKMFNAIRNNPAVKYLFDAYDQFSNGNYKDALLNIGANNPIAQGIKSMLDMFDSGDGEQGVETQTVKAATAVNKNFDEAFSAAKQIDIKLENYAVQTAKEIASIRANPPQVTINSDTKKTEMLLAEAVSVLKSIASMGGQQVNNLIVNGGNRYPQPSYSGNIDPRRLSM